MKSIVLLAVLLFIIIPARATYSSSLALELGYFSGAAYESTASIQAWNCSYCKKYPLSDIKLFSNSVGGIQGFAAYSHGLNAIVVAFRGSNNIQNWILNIGTTKTSYSLCSNCAVHSGFMSGYNFVATAVKTAVETLRAKYKNVKLYITGHSLGGALAILCTAHLKSVFGHVDLTYTYGQPRVGNPEFASWYQSHFPNTYRLVDYADIVPHVPPSSFGFLHSSSQAWYQRGMTSYKICDAESAACANSIGTTNYSTDDHNLDNYLKLRALNGIFAPVIEAMNEGASKLADKHLRGKQEQSQDWVAEEERKVNQILGIFGEEYTMKSNVQIQ